MDQQQQEQQLQQSFPEATTDGFVYENDTDKTMGIETNTHVNGNQVKRIRLSNGSIAMVRELKGHDVQKAERLHGGDESLFMPAMCSIATKIDGQPQTPEELLDLKAKDYNKIRIANATLNF